MLDHRFKLWGIESRWVELDRLKVDTLASSRWLKSAKVLRVTIDFGHIDELRNSLESLTSLLKICRTEVCLLQVRYKLQTLSSEARLLHEYFLSIHPKVSSYLPLCLPPSPLGPQVQWATPESCHTCLFFEGKSCAGLNGEEFRETDPSQMEGVSGGALRQSWSEKLEINEFKTSPPACYWWPQVEIIEHIRASCEARHCKTLWDIGGGNAFLGWLFKRELPFLDHALCIDPVVDQYPKVAGVSNHAMTAEEGMQYALDGRFQMPDVLIISWPSPGALFGELIERLKPTMIIRVTDSEGVCGVRRGHRALMIGADEGCVYGLAEGFTDQGDELDELDPPQGYELSYENTVWCYRDFQKGAQRASGLLRVFERLT